MMVMMLVFLMLMFFGLLMLVMMVTIIAILTAYTPVSVECLAGCQSGGACKQYRGKQPRNMLSFHISINKS